MFHLLLVEKHQQLLLYGCCEQQAVSGRMFVPLNAEETTQAEFKNQLSELMLTSHNNEQSLKSCHMQLNNWATMVMSIMNKLEYKSMMSPPDDSGGNHDQVPRSPPPSPHARKSPNLNRLALLPLVLTL